VLGSLLIGFQTWQTSQERQITERFSTAVDQIGSKSTAVRIGGVHALTRIACDSERDRPTIEEVLLAFVRENTQHAKPLPPALGLDVHAALKALVTNTCLAVQSDDRKLDLSFLSLPGAQIPGARLAKANLAMTNLVGANLIDAQLQGAILSSADLSFALLNGVNFKGAVLHGVRLYKTQLDGADLSQALIDEASVHAACVEDSTGLPTDMTRPKRCTDR
jgi:hypothetical protein